MRLATGRNAPLGLDSYYFAETFSVSAQHEEQAAAGTRSACAALCWGFRPLPFVAFCPRSPRASSTGERQGHSHKAAFLVSSASTSRDSWTEAVFTAGSEGEVEWVVDLKKTIYISFLSISRRLVCGGGVGMEAPRYAVSDMSRLDWIYSGEGLISPGVQICSCCPLSSGSGCPDSYGPLLTEEIDPAFPP